MRVCLSWLSEWVALPNLPPAQIAERLTLAGLEVKLLERDAASGEQVFETEVTTNRPDWLSHRGVARELAAVFRKSFKDLPCRSEKKRREAAKFSVLTADPKGCPYYSAVILQDIEVPNTPDWMAKRLRACGVRPIHFLVDVTNYVLLEWGQPLHAFDLERLSGARLEARRARKGEALTAIDGRTYSLGPNDVVIADAKGPVAIGGVMGGSAAEVTEKTRSIALESACFDPRAVRRTCLAFGLRSESSYRFERGVDPEAVDQARERAVYLITKFAKVGRVSRVLKAGGIARSPRTLTYDFSESQKWLGATIEESEIRHIFKRLGLGLAGHGKRRVRVTVPAFRKDLARPIDLAEEAARLYGYDRIPGTLPARPPLAFPAHPGLVLEERVRDVASALGFSEVVTFSIISKKAFEPYGFRAVELANPQSDLRNALRPTLVLSLLEAACQNVRSGAKDLRLFEVARTYRPAEAGALPEERPVCALLLWGGKPRSWLDPARAYTLFDLKGCVERLVSRLHLPRCSWHPEHHPVFERGHSLSLHVQGTRVGAAGQVSTRAVSEAGIEGTAFACELDLQSPLAFLKGEAFFEPPARTPHTRQDMAFLIDAHIAVGDVLHEMEERGGSLLRSVELADVYQGKHVPEGKRSLAFTLLYQHPERTLTTEEVIQLHTDIFQALARRFHVSPR